VPIRNSRAINNRPRGVSDSADGTNAFAGAMKSIVNMIPDQRTAQVWRPRPAATRLVDLAESGVISALLVVGEIAYGMVASSTHAGKDEPFAYDSGRDVFLVIDGITSGNLPTTQPDTGDWTPPIMCVVAGRVIVTHPGFPGDGVQFGWFDVSGIDLSLTGDTVNGTRYITGNPNLLGVQPGDLITGPGIPAGTTVVNTHPYYLGFDFVGDMHSSTLIDGIADTTSIKAGLFLSGAGIPPGTTVVAVHHNSIDISQAATITAAAQTVQCFGNNVLGHFPPADAFGNTHTSTTVDGIFPIDAAGLPLGAAIGQGVSGNGILPLTTITAVGPGNQITLSQATISTVTGVFLAFDGVTIVMSANATATADAVSVGVRGGTRTRPLWGAGTTDNFKLPSTPVGVAQMNGRAWYALGFDGIVFSDSGLPCRVSNTSGVQALTTNDGLRVTALGQQQLGTPLTGGIVQALIAFEEDIKLQQITGDQATGNLAINALPEGTGTHAPLSIEPIGGGKLAFISPIGLRTVGLDGGISGPLGIDGQGVVHPFQFAKYPSRICAAYNAGVLRISVQHVHLEGTGEPFEEYWLDIARGGIWHGPHTFPARLIQSWRTGFLMAPQAVNGSLWRSDAYVGVGGAYVENGAALEFSMETVLQPDNAALAMNKMVKANLTCAMAEGGLGTAIGATVYDEDGVILDASRVDAGRNPKALRERPIFWNVPVEFKQMSVKVYGFSSDDIRIGNLYMLYEMLGYSMEAPFINYLYDDSTPPRLLTDDRGEPLISDRGIADDIFLVAEDGVTLLVAEDGLTYLTAG
jgi:hypothetical protein